MSLVFDSPVPLEDAIAFVRDQPFPSNNALMNLFPTRTFNNDEVDFSELTLTHRVLKYRNWDGAFAPLPRDTFSEKRHKLLPLGGFREKGEYERRQEEYARTSGTNTAGMVAAIYNDLEHLTEYAYNRLELGWGDVLTDGILTIAENGVDQALDFGLPAAHKVTAGTLWSDTTNSTPLTNLIAWQDVYTATNQGGGFGRFITSLEVLRLLMKNKELINAIKGDQTGVTMVSLPEINALFAGFGLPGLELPPAGAVAGGSVYNSSFDVDGTSTRVVAANKFMAFPANIGELGFTAIGMPTTAMELNSNNVQVDVGPGLIGIIVREANPPYRKHVYVDGVGMPVLADARKLFVATVTA